MEKRENVTVGTLHSTLSRLGDSGLEIAEVTYNLPLEGLKDLATIALVGYWHVLSVFYILYIHGYKLGPGF